MTGKKIVISSRCNNVCNARAYTRLILEHIATTRYLQSGRQEFHEHLFLLYCWKVANFQVHNTFLISNDVRINHLITLRAFVY